MRGSRSQESPSRFPTSCCWPASMLTTFEADRTANPFDRGHLVRRLDSTWGDTVDEAKQHGDDSFHFTNCSPQFWSFNQGKQLWAGLEDYTRHLTAQQRQGHRHEWSHL